MCQSKSEGGKRCEYADLLATVRRTTRRKHQNTWSAKREQEVQKAVVAWQEAHPEIVTAHLPEKQPFQVKPNQKPVPEELKAMFTASSKNPVIGFPEAQRDAHTKALFEEQEAWQESLTDEERRTVRHYAMAGFESMNTMARRKGYAAWVKENGYEDWEGLDDQTKERIRHMDSALAKAPRPEGPRKLYRFFRVPAGVTPTEYMNRYFQDGGAFKDAGFMSTTADPEFIMAHMEHRNKGKKNHGYIVMEMISKRGASLQPEEDSRGGDVQSLEKEVLLPRNTKFRIIGSRRSQKFAFASDRDDLTQQYHRHTYQRKYYMEGDEMRFPIIQMVDEDLITEHHRTKKEN